MFLSIVGKQRYEIVTVKRWTARPAMPTLATSGMIGRRLDAGRNPPAGFLRSETGRSVSVSLCGRRDRQPCRIGIDQDAHAPKQTTQSVTGRLPVATVTVAARRRAKAFCALQQACKFG